jgi:LDH2 family malate/lactate/ureidoglycolate dehydrogenase
MTHDKSSQGATRYSAESLVSFAIQLLQKLEMPPDRARIVAEILVEADLMGHSTHGLQLLANYLRDLDSGSMRKDGESLVIADHGSALTWDGQYLPGPWLVYQAIETAVQRISAHPVVTVVIRHSHHIACLAAYLKRVTDQGLMILLASSDPSTRSVAPYGGTQALYTPNPLAVGIPTGGDPILIDISMSTTANGVVARLHQQGQRLPHPWVQDNQGNATDDPAALFTDPPGSILPLGGTDLGYKGFALGLLIEALTGALGGNGRSTQPKNWGASVFLQLINPDAFGGRSAFIQETEWLSEAARNNPPPPGKPPVRLPGSQALRRRTEQLQVGVALYPTIMPSLVPWAEKLDVPIPVPINQSTD